MKRIPEEGDVWYNAFFNWLMTIDMVEHDLVEATFILDARDAPMSITYWESDFKFSDFHYIGKL
jgi:hypothetical protein